MSKIVSSPRRSSPPRTPISRNWSPTKSERKSPFLNQLKRREINILTELKQLQEENCKLHEEKQQLKEEKEQIKQRQAELLEYEKQINQKENLISTIPLIRRSTREIEKQIEFLNQCASQLKDQIDIAKTEIDSISNEMESNNQSSNELIETIDRLREEIEEHKRKHEELEKEESQYTDVLDLMKTLTTKSFKVKSLETEISALQGELDHKRNTIDKKEQMAKEHQEKLDFVAEERRQLEERRTEVNAKKKELLDQLSFRDEERKKLMEKRQKIREEMEACEQTTISLDKTSDQIAIEEERLNEVKLAREEADKNLQSEIERQKAIEKGEPQQANEDMEQNLNESGSILPSTPSKNTQKKEFSFIDYIAQYEDDAAAIEKRYDRMERQANEKKGSVELEQFKWDAFWKDKHQSADQMIFDLEVKLQGQKSAEELAEDLKKIQQEYDEKVKEIQEKEKNLDDMRRATLSERSQAEKQDNDLIEERLKLEKIKKEVEQRFLQLQQTRDEIANTEDGVRTEKEELEAKLKSLKLEMESDEREFSISQQKLEDAKQRNISLKEQKNQIEAQKNS